MYPEGSKLVAEKALYAQQTTTNRISDSPVPTDPASLRAVLGGLQQFLDRLHTQHNRLNTIADFVQGPEVTNEEIKGGPTPPIAGGITGDIVQSFAAIGDLLRAIDREIERLQRVSS